MGLSKPSQFLNIFECIFYSKEKKYKEEGIWTYVTKTND